MRILIIMNNAVSPAGRIGERIERHGGECVTVNPVDGEALGSDAADLDGLLVLGGPMSVADPAYDHVFAPMFELVRDYHAREKPIMGICLGAQIVARAFGKAVVPASEFQFGFKSIKFTDAGREDPLLEGLGPVVRVFVHHSDTYELPDEAELLMTTAEVPNHSYRIGRTTYCFQGHLEATAEIIRGWLARPRQPVIECFGEERGRAMLDGNEQDMGQDLENALTFADTVGDRWIDLASVQR
jgi:GMP synthase (glutamine-hydrolysing)